MAEVKKFLSYAGLERYDSNLKTYMGNNYYKKEETYSKTETDVKLATALSTVYTARGGIAFASLPELDAAYVTAGSVYNITDEFTIDSRFLEYDTDVTKTYPAGTNIVCVETGAGDLYWDVLGGFFDMEVDEITNEEIDSMFEESTTS